MIMQPSSAEGPCGRVTWIAPVAKKAGTSSKQRRESGEIFGAEVVGHNRGGLLVNVEGVNAFVPLSQVDSLRRDDPQAITQLATLVGNTIQLKVLELNRRKNRAILSERAAMSEWRKEQKERVLARAPGRRDSRRPRLVHHRLRRLRRPWWRRRPRSHDRTHLGAWQEGPRPLQGR